MEFRAVAIKTELRCKICVHVERTRIDALLLARSLREKDELGQAINLQYVLDAMADLGVENPTSDNVKVHWKKHVEVMDGALKDQQEEERAQKIADRMNEPVDVDAVLDKIIRAGEIDLDFLIENGDKSGVTVDQVLKAAQVKSGRKQDEKVQQLLTGMAGAIGGAFAQRALQPAPEPRELKHVRNLADVIDVEATEVEEG